MNKLNMNSHLTNCPNCGATIENPICPYCGTILYDFANIDANSYSYIRIKIGNDLIWFKAKVDSVTFSESYDSAVFYYDNYRFKSPPSGREVKISIDFSAIKDEKTNALFMKANKNYESSNRN